MKDNVVWKVYTNGSSNFEEAGINVIIWDDDHSVYEYSARITFPVTNNVAEYEVVIFKVMTLWKLSALNLVLFSDTRLVVNQYASIFGAKDDEMKRYLERLKHECYS